ncbi:MAG: hypothetical protein O3C28_15410 [Proteobacteria bacterium]|nr:hypothetical protein [Pseudomonadota bacterium]
MSQTPTRRKVVPLRYVEPAKRRATQYEEVTLHSQWDPKNFAIQGWFNRDIHGRPPWDEHSTALKATEWWAYRDPAQDWFRPYVTRQVATGNSITQAIEGATRAQLFDGLLPKWKVFLETHYAAYRYPEYGLFMALSYAQREALSDVVAGPLLFQSMEKDRHAQDIALYGMALEDAIPGFDEAQSKTLWMESPVWQGARRVIEYLMASRDWGEINFVINLIYEPLFATLFNRELVLRTASRHGDTVAAVIAEGAEKDRQHRQASAVALVGFLLGEEGDNRVVLHGWIEHWAPLVTDAVDALAPLFDLTDVQVQTFAQARQMVFEQWRTLMRDSELDIAAVYK